ncbi:MAG: hypothetical protein AMXMBFR13_36510 [Phycisphaerae bacterium]
MAVTRAIAMIGLFGSLLSAAPVVSLRPVPPSDISLRGYLGQRLDRNLQGILLHKDENALLEPFRQRKGRDQAWAGEHVGKWLSAASMACAYSGDEALRAKLERVAQGLMATQMQDGYLGTYIENDRWTSWDVWVHKYNLLGLGAYYDLTSDEAALQTCRRIGDLMITTFGPDRRDILKAGEHQGMASASILEPMLWLYRRSDDKRYLDFAEYIVASLERENGPRIVGTLLRERDVRKVSTAKAYEMISCIVGLLEMYRINGDSKLLEAATIACDDILRKHLYVTGGCSYGEHFSAPGVFPNAGHVAETCVTMSLMQLYDQLLQLTGERRYAHAAEHLIFNHLLACQKPDGEAIAYYTPLWGNKFHMDFLGCCISSGPRALAMVPSFAYHLHGDQLAVNLLTAGELATRLPNGQNVRIVQATDYPFSDEVKLAVSVSPAACALAIRMPPTAHQPKVLVDGSDFKGKVTPGSHITFMLDPGEHLVELDLGLRWEIFAGTSANDGLFALRYGQVVFAFELDLNDKTSRPEDYVFEKDLGSLAPVLSRKEGRWIATVNGYHRGNGGTWNAQQVTLLPFADASAGGGYFSVWLADRSRSARGPFSLYTQAHEKTSRAGRQRGSMVDNSPETFTTTDDGQRRDEDWFEVNAGWHTNYNVIVFHHGKSFPNGGWFDTSKGKPRVFLQSWKEYREVAVIEDYPDTTASSPGTLNDGQAFRVIIPGDLRKPDFRIRIVGAPAHGNDPAQNFASCGEIQVFYDPNE